MRKLKYIIVLSGIVIFFYIISVPAPANLSIQGKNVLAIFVLSLVLWVTNIIPLAATSLLAIALLPLLKVIKPSESFSYFGNEALFFLLGVFIISAATIRTGLSKRITLKFLSYFDKSPRRLLFGTLVTTAFCALWMPCHAVAAMTFPVILEIVTSLGLKPHKSTFAKSLFLAMAWGSIIGGTGTFLGGARVPLAAGLLKEAYGINISFIRWSVTAFPVVIIMFFTAFGILIWKFVPELKDVGLATVFLRKQLHNIGKFTLPEIKLLCLILITILCWIFMGNTTGLATISIISAVLVFILKISTWNSIQDYVNWGIIIMYGGAIALGKALASTGCLEWCAENLILINNMSAAVLIMFIPLLSIFLTEGISNAAVIAILLPLGFSITEYLHITPVAMVFLITIPAGLPFCLPISSPPNAIAFSSGYYRIKDSLKSGIILNIAAVIIFWIVMYFYWPLIGMKLF